MAGTTLSGGASEDYEGVDHALAFGHSKRQGFLVELGDFGAQNGELKHPLC